MTQEATHRGSLTKIGLQRSLRKGEADLFKLLSISVSGGSTVSTHDNSTIVPRNSLVLEEDPSGNMEAPEGMDVVCRGKALIAGEEKSVAAFRKKPAAG